jgi:predicted nucleotidyltransferase
MKATAKDKVRLEAEVKRLVQQLRSLGAQLIILFGSLAKGKISLFSDIDLLVLFDDDRPPRALTRWVYQQIDSREAVDIIAYDRSTFERIRQRPFFRHILQEGKVLYERS